MPELPEVETIARALREGGRDGVPILNRRIEDAALYWERTLATPPWDAVAARLVGQRVQAVGRRGKVLILTLDDGHLLFHLRMSGDLRVEPQSAPRQKHDRLHILLSDGVRLTFNDPRKFGRAWWADDPAEVTGHLGPEPLSADFTPEWLAAALAGRKRAIKPLLLDQTFIAGLGNIYTDEALHRAGIHPLTPANRIPREHVHALWQAIRTVLEEGIRRNGASIDWVYRGGGFQNDFRVYHRAGQPCPTCGTPVRRIVVGQRGTHLCPRCQPLEEER